MLFTVKQDLELLRTLNLTTRQLMFVKMIIPDDSIEESVWKRRSYAMALEFQDLCPMEHEELIDLITRDIVVDYNDLGQRITYDNYEVNPKYLAKFKISVIGKPSQLFNTYPNFFDNGTVRYNAKDAGPEEFAPMYLKAIEDDDEEGIKKFVSTRGWNGIRELRLKEKKVTFNDSSLG